MKYLDFMNWIESYFAEEKYSSDFDLQFIKRNYSDENYRVPAERFMARLEMMGCTAQEKVLDFGCGFGQWTIAASKLNTFVTAIDPDVRRVNFLQSAIRKLSLDNIEVRTGGVENLDSEEDFSFILCYGVLPFLDWKLALRKFHSLLKKGGSLYFNSYDIGWMVYNIVENPNQNANFSSRAWAEETIRNTYKQKQTNFFFQQNFLSSIYIPIEDVLAEVQDVGFEIINYSGDGMSDVRLLGSELPFFPANYMGLNCVYEFVCLKT